MCLMVGNFSPSTHIFIAEVKEDEDLHSCFNLSCKDDQRIEKLGGSVVWDRKLWLLVGWGLSPNSGTL